MEIRPILSTLSRHKTAASLIVLEIALACAIVCNALFLVGSRLEQINEVSGLAEDELVRVQLTSIGGDDDADALTRTDLASLRSIPGVRAATVLNQVPFVNSSWNSGLQLEKEQDRDTLNATVYMAADQFVDTLGLRIVSGRDFEPGEYMDYSVIERTDAFATHIPVALVTRQLAETLFPGEDAVGKTFYSWGDSPTRIIGVIEHLVRPSMQGGPTAREYSMVFPVRTHYNVGGNYVLRTQPERRDEVLKAAVAALRANANNRIILDKNTKTVQQLRSEFYRQPRSMVWLLGAVIVALLIVTALGIVGLASFWVQQRTKQIGIRRALGATRGQILGYFQTENFLLTTSGIVLGMLLAYALNQLLMSKYELPRLPIWYLPIGAVLLWALGQLAVFWPARRAAAVPPVVATRSA
ncbi:FtsX-like permease family protein [Stenotrophomonas sp. MMGLT7]|uniref:ABC transporter permease n=1 Tax=Stenotrophomonas sp. MMGLT7 TaxID=2901227 RepID=UPI001E2BC96A|nr:FtsX-like permease family protein [Stenotrophomonas sp. MMGLT7]MCD7099227.1 FtsX-like permease family protein [Stenotrophomonas sp. MMGLT7]